MSSSTISKNTQLYSTYDNRSVADSQLYPLLYNADLWVDISDTSTFAVTGTGIQKQLSGNLSDKSKNANHLIPTATGIYYDDQTLGFVLNTQYFMPTTSIPSRNSETFFLVVDFWGSDISTTQYMLGFNPSNSVGQRLFRIDNVGLRTLSNATTLLVGASPIIEARRYLIGFVNNGGYLQHYINGKIDGSVSGTTFSSNNPTAFFGNAGFNVQLRGVIHECLFYQSALSTNQRQLIEYYLMNKWKLAPNSITNPTSVSGCKLWLDASDAASITAFNGTIVTGWNDKSGNANHATGISSYQPGYSSGTPTITFSGTQGMRTPYVPAATGETIFLVMKSTTLNATIQQYFIDSSNVSSGRNYRLPTSATKKWYCANGGGTTLAGIVSFTTASYATNMLYCGIIAGTGGTSQYINKVRDTTSATTNNPTAGTYTQIGARSSPPSSGLNGSISEIVAYNTVLSASDRELVSNYLMNKWSLSSLSGTFVNTYNGFQKIPPILRYFTPNDIDNCVLWIDAADKATVTTSGSTVTGLANKADTMAITTSGTPTWSATGLNSLPAIDLTNGRFIGAFSTVVGSTLVKYANTCFIVGSMTTVPGDGSALLAFAQAATGSTVFYRALDYATSTFRTVSFFAAVAISSQTSVTNTPFIWTSSYRSDGNSFPLATSINGGTVVNSTVTTQPTTTPTHFMIGTDGFTGGTTVNTWPGKVCEIIIFNRIIGIAESQQIEGYLADKWGLRSNLPTLHTLKNINPLLPPFNPRSVPTCTFWYDIADKSTLTYEAGSTVNVSGIADKSGFGINLTTLNSTYKITTANTMNGLPTLTFPGDPADNNGTLNYFTSGSTACPTSNTANYAFFVLRFNPYVLQGTSTARSWGLIFPFSVYVTYGMQGGLQRVSGSWYLNYNLSFVGSGATGTAVVSNSSSGPSVGTPVLGMFGRNNSTTGYVFSYNGTYEAKTGVSATIVGGTPLYVGPFFQAQELCELIMYQGKVLTTQEIQKVEGYLAWKWGVVGNLPATHLYKKTPP